VCFFQGFHILSITVMTLDSFEIASACSTRSLRDVTTILL
jgi:hypothetical protein